MDIRDLIINKIKKGKEVKVADIVKATGFSRSYVSRVFKELKEKRAIIQIGKANRANYILATKKAFIRKKKEILGVKRILANRNLSESDILDEIKRDTGIFLDLPQNISAILDYAFTEILNNAIEHSMSKKIVATLQKTNNRVIFEIVDFGIGIFNNIMRKRELKNELEAIQDLLKGKQTTKPKEHSGEGVFFTSKASDKLIIRSFGKKLIIDNSIKDIFIEDIKNIKGTRVKFEICAKSKKDLNKIFKEYSEGAFDFGRTQVRVELYEIADSYISRSQARRVLSGLDNFRTIILDFKNIKTVGQGFADEVFRVWQKRHSKIKIIYKNANENIIFMIQRAQKSA